MIHQLSEIIADFLLKKMLFLKQNMTYTLMVMNQFGRKASTNPNGTASYP